MLDAAKADVHKALALAGYDVESLIEAVIHGTLKAPNMTPIHTTLALRLVRPSCG